MIGANIRDPETALSTLRIGYPDLPVSAKRADIAAAIAEEPTRQELEQEASWAGTTGFFTVRESDLLIRVLPASAEVDPEVELEFATPEVIGIETT